MTVHQTRNAVTITSNLKTQKLEAWFGGAHLWSTTPSEPGSVDEVAEFYTATLIRLLEVVEVMSAHERMQLLSKGRASAGLPGDKPVALLGAYPA